VLGPGLQFHFPVIEEIYASENISKIRTFVLPTNMLTKDENIVDVELNVQYTISDLKAYSLNVEDPEITIRQAAESALRHVVGENLMDDLLTSGAAAISSGILLRLDEYLAIYEAGISVQQVNIEQRQPPAEVIDSFRDVVAAREDKERLRNEAQKYALSIVPVARGDAQRQLQDAEAYKQKVMAVAEGEADRFTALLAEYKKAPEVTRERLYLDSLEQVLSSSTKIMIDVEGGNNLLYLPLDQLMKREEEDDE
jgi:membrane protease subunit HflK